MKRCVFLAILLVLVMYSQKLKADQNKAEQTSTVLRSANAIFEVATNSKKNAAVKQNEIKSIIENIKMPESLAKLAIMVRLIAHPQNAGEENFDEYFDFAFWRCVGVLAGGQGEQDRRALNVIKRFSDLQSGDLLRFNELVGGMHNKEGS